MVDAHDRERQNIWFRDPYGSGNRGYITVWADAAKLHGGPDTLDTFDDWVEALAAGLSSYLGRRRRCRTSSSRSCRGS